MQEPLQSCSTLVAFFFLFFSHVSAGAASLPVELARVLAEISPPDRYSVHIETEARRVSSGQAGKSSTAGARYVADQVCDSGRFDLLLKQYSTSGSGTTLTFEQQCLFDGKWWLESQTMHSASTRPVPTFAAVTAGNAAEFVSGAKNRSHGGWFVTGEFPGDEESIAEVLLGASEVQTRTGQLDGVDCIICSAKTKRGLYTVWIARASTPQLLRATVQRQHGDLFGRILLPMALRDGQVVSVNDEMDHLKYTTLSSRRVPVSGRLRRMQTRADGAWDRIEFQTRWSSFELNPRIIEGTTFALNGIQNGHAIRVMDRPNLYHSWRDGQPVIDETEAAVQHVDAAVARERSAVASRLKQIGEIPLWRRPTIGFGILFIVTGAVVWVIVSRLRSAP